MVEGDVIPTKYRVFNKIMNALRLSEVGRWFKINNKQFPAARYTVFNLTCYVHTTLYKAAQNPRNQQAFLDDKPHLYDKSVIRNIYRTFDSWFNKLLSNCRGGELFSESLIYRSK